MRRQIDISDFTSREDETCKSGRVKETDKDGTSGHVVVQKHNVSFPSNKAAPL